MRNTNDSAKKPISKSAITAIVSAVTSIPLAFGRPVLAKFFCSIFVDVSIVFAVIALITVFGTRKHGSRASPETISAHSYSLSPTFTFALFAIVLSLYVR